MTLSPDAGEPVIEALGRHYFEDLSVGMRFGTQSRTVTEADVVAFACLSGDFNPIHVDAQGASSGPFGRRVAHGLLIQAVATGLRHQSGVFVGVIRAFAEIRSWRFLSPVFIGDTIRVVTTISSVRATSRPGQGLVEQQIDVLNQNDVVVQSGVFVTLVACRET